MPMVHLFRQKFCPALSLLLLLQIQVSAAAQPDTSNWELRRDREGIQVYTRKLENSPYDAVRSVMLVNNLTLSSLVALLMDSDACPQWADKCAESYVYEAISNTELLVYTHNDLPFPVKDRDILSRVSWSQDPMTLTVTMVSRAASGILEKRKGRLRLTKADVSWSFEPLKDGRIKVVNEAHIDPGSALPGWITNMLLVDTPYETLKAMRSEAAKPKYASAEISFVQELGG